MAKKVKTKTVVPEHRFTPEELKEYQEQKAFVDRILGIDASKTVPEATPEGEVAETPPAEKPPEDFSIIETLIERLEDTYKAEVDRAGAIERKSTYLMGFAGIVTTFFGKTALDLVTATKGTPWATWILSISLVVALGFFIRVITCALQVLRTRNFSFLDDRGLEKLPIEKKYFLRETAHDLFYMIKYNRGLTDIRGGFLQAGQRALGWALGLLLTSLMLSLLFTGCLLTLCK